MSLKIFAEIIREDTSLQLKDALSRVEDITLSMHVPVDEDTLKADRLRGDARCAYP